MSFWNGHEWVAESPPAAEAKLEGRVKHVAKAVLEASLITTLTFGLIAGSAFAARGGGKPGGGGGGGGGHHGGGGTLSATVAVSPNPVPAYSEFDVGGCGYTPGGGVQFNLYAPGVTAIWGGTANSAGCVSTTGWANGAGSAKLDVLAGSVTVVASTTFAIQ